MTDPSHQNALRLTLEGAGRSAYVHVRLIRVGIHLQGQTTIRLTAKFKIRETVQSVGYLRVVVTEGISFGINHIPNLDVPQTVTGNLAGELKEAGEVYVRLLSHGCVWHRGNTYAQVWRQASRELVEEGRVCHRCHRASSERIEVLGGSLLPIRPDLVDHLGKNGVS